MAHRSWAWRPKHSTIWTTLLRSVVKMMILTGSVLPLSDLTAGTGQQAHADLRQ